VEVCIHAATLPEADPEPGWDCRVAADVKEMAEKSCDDNSAKIEGRADGLTQKRMLKMKLKVRWWTFTVRKDRPQMLHGLQQRLGFRISKSVKVVGPRCCSNGRTSKHT
jgi:hypothetical protein